MWASAWCAAWPSLRLNKKRDFTTEGTEPAERSVSTARMHGRGFLTFQTGRISDTLVWETSPPFSEVLILKGLEARKDGASSPASRRAREIGGAPILVGCRLRRHSGEWCSQGQKQKMRPTQRVAASSKPNFIRLKLY